MKMARWLLFGVVALALALFLAGVGVYALRTASSAAYERQAEAAANLAAAHAAAQSQVAQTQAVLEQDRLRQEHEIARQQAEQWRAMEAAWIAPAWGLFSATVPAVLSLALVLALGMVADAYWQRRKPLVEPDRRGLLPVERGQLGSLTAISIGLLEQHQQQQGQTQLAGASRPVLPQHYAPHISYQYKGVEAPALPAPAPQQAVPVAVPTFAELLTNNIIGDGQPLLLGYGPGGEALTGSWLDLYSTAVAGMSGTGKTTSQRFLAAQVALQGAKFVIVDPHAGAGGDSLAGTLSPLSGLFMCEPASTDKAILDAVRLVADIGRRRVAGQDRDRSPLILWLDEATSLLGRGAIKDELGELLERIAQEYRKRFVFACVSGQIWTASRSGGSELRDSFASVLCHRMKRAQARLLLPTDEAQTVERLATGQAVLWRTSGESTIVTIPNTTQHDIEGVARLIERPATGLQSAYNRPIPMLTEDAGGWIGRPDVGQNKPESVVTAEALTAARMFYAQQMEPAQIVLALRGVNSKQGVKYQQALAEVLDLIRQGMPAVMQGGAGGAV